MHIWWWYSIAFHVKKYFSRYRKSAKSPFFSCPQTEIVKVSIVETIGPSQSQAIYSHIIKRYLYLSNRLYYNFLSIILTLLSFHVLTRSPVFVPGLTFHQIPIVHSTVHVDDKQFLMSPWYVPVSGAVHRPVWTPKG